jgi:hypothetical protein
MVHVPLLKTTSGLPGGHEDLVNPGAKGSRRGAPVS